MTAFTDNHAIDVLVLDIGLPDIDGRDLCRALRANGQAAPVMFLSAISDVHEIVHGFASGALDYLTKPFAIPELVARIEALARRATPRPHGGSLRIDPDRFALVCDGQQISLTPTEFRLAAELLAHTGTLVHRTELINAGWAPGAQVHQNTLDSYLYRLRHHLTQLDAPATIKTIRGVGYILNTTR